LKQNATENLVGRTKSATQSNTICMLSIALFAIGFPAADMLLETWGVISLVTARVVLACSLMMPLWILIDGRAQIMNAPWLRALGIGALGFGSGTILLLVVQDMTDPISAALIAATMPVSAIILEILFDGRRLTKNFMAGTVLVLTGGFLATGAVLQEGPFGSATLLGGLASVMFAWGSRQAVKGLPELTSFGQATATLIGAMAFCILTFTAFKFMAWEGTETAALGSWGWSMLLIYAWGALAISQAFWILGVSRLGIGIASFHLNAAPFYVMLILLFAGGSWDWTRALGAAVLGLGVVLAQKHQVYMIYAKSNHHEVLSDQ
jgi:drug/metabolite transporter (DMT)-like permease